MALPCVRMTGLVQPLRNVILGRFTSVFATYTTASAAASSENGTLTGSSPNSSVEAGDLARTQFQDSLSQLLFYAAILAAAAWIAAFLQAVVYRVAAQWQARYLRELYADALLLAADPAWMAVRPSHAVAALLTTEIDAIETFLAEKLPWVLRNLVIFSAGLILAFRSSVVLSLAILSAFSIVGAILGIMHHRSKTSDKLLVLSYASASKVALEVFAAIRTVMAFNRQASEAKRYDSHLQTAQEARINISFSDGIGWGLYNGTMFFAFAISFHMGGHLVASASIEPGDVLIVFTQIAVGITALGNLGQVQRDFDNGLRILRLLSEHLTELELLAAESQNNDFEPEAELGDVLNGRIEFRAVSFRYPSRPDQWVLKDFSLVIEPGEHIAIVGESGCGKSTLFHLLTRLYKPDSGCILIDGIDISRIRLDSLRRHMGVATQKTALFDATVFDNIAFGSHQPVGSVAIENIEDACDIAQATSFISSLSEGLETRLTPPHDVTLSGGQVQRIAIARALIGAASGLLLLDEATSALDAATERRVLSGILQHRLGRTTLMISHRIASLEGVSRILVLHKDRLVEDGTFQKLSSEPTLFRTLLQAHAAPEAAPLTAPVLSGLPELHLLPDLKAHVDDAYTHQTSSSLKNPEKLIKSNLDEAVLGTNASSTKKGSSEKQHLLSKSHPTEDKRHTYLRHMIRFFDRVARIAYPDLPFVLVGQVAGFIEGFQFPIEGYIIGKVVASYSLPTSEQIHASTAFWSSMIALLGACVFCTAVVHSTFVGSASARIVSRTRSQLFRHLVHQDMIFFSAKVHNPARLSTILADDAEKISHLSINFFGDLLRASASIATGLAIGLWNSWHMVVVMAAPFPFIFLLSSVQTWLVRMFSRKQQVCRDQAVRIAHEIAMQLDAIALLGQAHHFRSEYRRIIAGRMLAEFQHEIFVAFSRGTVESLVIIVFSLGLWAGGAVMLRGWATNEQVLVSVVTITLTVVNMAQIANSIAYALGSAHTAVQGVFDLLDTQPQISVLDQDGHRSEKDTLASAEDSSPSIIEFRNVSFTYPGADRPAVFNVSFNVQLGTKVAFVGTTGSGKSTILSLIQRMYEPQEGQILLAGVDLRDWHLATLRSHLGIVPQAPDLFDATLRENISYACPAASMADIERAARMANLHTFVSSLEQGYDTRIGEHGSLLSGGQRQRVAIARLYLAAPRLILLDEATSALDGENESAIIQSIEEFARESNKSVLVVTHRLQTVSEATRIHVMWKGRIVESGTHRDLQSRETDNGWLSDGTPGLVRCEFTNSGSEELPHGAILRTKQSMVEHAADALGDDLD
jgi:ATP-binding cassette subfamily B (MDR/TAP) protein 1